MLINFVLLFFFGAFLGSFLNACIYRFPRDISLLKPARSFCPHCRKKLSWLDLLPLFSYILLLGRCRYCRKPIGLRYFLVEFLSGLLLALLLFSGVTLLNILLFCELYLLLGIFFADLETQIIPDEFSLLGIVLGLSYAFFSRQFSAGLVSCALAGSLFWLIAKTGRYFYKKEALGGGDIKLVMLLGSFLTPIRILLTLYLAFVLGSIFALFLILLKQKSRKDYIPFGPLIVIAGLLVIFLGETLLKVFFPFI